MFFSAVEKIFFDILSLGNISDIDPNVSIKQEKIWCKFLCTYIQQRGDFKRVEKIVAFIYCSIFLTLRKCFAHIFHFMPEHIC